MCDPFLWQLIIQEKAGAFDDDVLAAGKRHSWPRRSRWMTGWPKSKLQTIHFLQGQYMNVKSNHLTRIHKTNVLWGWLHTQSPPHPSKQHLCHQHLGFLQISRQGWSWRAQLHPSLGTYSFNFADPEVYQTMIATNKRKIWPGWKNAATPLGSWWRVCGQKRWTSFHYGVKPPTLRTKHVSLGGEKRLAHGKT